VYRRDTGRGNSREGGGLDGSLAARTRSCTRIASCARPTPRPSRAPARDQKPRGMETLGAIAPWDGDPWSHCSVGWRPLEPLLRGMETLGAIAPRDEDSSCFLNPDPTPDDGRSGAPRLPRRGGLCPRESLQRPPPRHPPPPWRVRSVRGEGRGVSDQYGVRDAACGGESLQRPPRGPAVRGRGADPARRRRGRAPDPRQPGAARRHWSHWRPAELPGPPQRTRRPRVGGPWRARDSRGGRPRQRLRATRAEGDAAARDVSN